MEVNLLAAEGLPPGCLVSVRAGTTRRQAPADPSKLKLVFPKGLTQVDPFKVDLLAPVHTAELKFKAGCEQYAVEVPVNGTTASLTLGVKEVNSVGVLNSLNLDSNIKGDFAKGDQGEPVTPSTASRRHRMALQARTYLDEHNLLLFTQGLLQALIRDKPEDPWDFVSDCSYTAKKIGVEDPLIPTKKPEPEPIVNTVVKKVVETVEDTTQIAALKQQVSSLQEDLRKLQEELAWVKAQGGVKAPPSQLSLPMCQKASVGSWLMPKPVFKREEYYEHRPMYKMPSVGSWLAPVPFPKTFPTVSDELEELRSDLRTTLVQASQDGNLAKLLRKFTEDTVDLTAKKPVEIKWIPKEAVGSTAYYAKNFKTTSLFASFHAKNFDTKNPADEVRKLRERAALALVEAAGTGNLMKILTDVAEARPDGDADSNVSALRREMRSLLVEAGGDGRFDSALTKLKEKEDEVDIEAIRERAMALMSEGLQDGSLITSLEFLDTPEISARDALPMEEVQERARAMLRNGFLQASETDEEAAEAPAEAPEASAEPPAVEDELHGAKKVLATVLLKAGSDGSLMQALNDLHKAPVKHTTDTQTPGPMEEEPPPPPPPPPEPVEEDPLEVGKRTLEKAMADQAYLSELQRLAAEQGLQLQLGPMPPSPEELERQELERLRKQAQVTLKDACADGRLIEVLQDVQDPPPAPEPEESDDECEKLVPGIGASILKAGHDGSFFKALREVDDEEEKAARPQVQVLPFSDYYRTYMLPGFSIPEGNVRSLFPRPSSSKKKVTIDEQVTVVRPPPPAPAVLPFGQYYIKNFSSGGVATAQRLFPFEKPKPQEPPQEPKQEEPKQEEPLQEPKPKEPLQVCPPEEDKVVEASFLEAPPSPKYIKSGTLAELKDKLQDRTDRFKKENDALRRQNLRLQAVLEQKQAQKTHAASRSSSPTAPR